MHTLGELPALINLLELNLSIGANKEKVCWAEMIECDGVFFFFWKR